MSGTLRERALRLLARREHARLELSRKLAPHAESAEQLAALLDNLAERGLLVTELGTSGGTLEERYLELTGGAGAEEEA